MVISDQLGGLLSLTSVVVTLTGVVGAMPGPVVLNLLNVHDWTARGMAMGTANHGIGVASAPQVNELVGAFTGLAMGLNALATTIMLPLLWNYFS